MEEAPSSPVRTQSMESQGHSVYYDPPNFHVFPIKAFPFLVQWGLAYGSSWLLIQNCSPLMISNKLIFYGEIPGCLPFVPCSCDSVFVLVYLLLCFYISYINKNKVFVFLCLTYFTKFNTLHIYPHCSIWHDYILFYI